MMPLMDMFLEDMLFCSLAHQDCKNITTIAHNNHVYRAQFLSVFVFNYREITFLLCLLHDLRVVMIIKSNKSMKNELFKLKKCECTYVNWR